MSHVSRSCLIAAALFALPMVGSAQNTKASSDARIANALLAGPQAVVAKATVLDWPASDGGEFVELRRGTNGFYCLPDLPVTQGEDPMCVDQEWLDFLKAFMTGKTPAVKRLGIGYMLHGGAYGSNTDPTATKATSDNQWGLDGSHLMFVVPDVKQLAGFPTTRSDGPFVMWAGTPYAHLMVPSAGHKEHGKMK